MGREIENYIPVNIIRNIFSSSKLKQIEQFDHADDYLKYLNKSGIKGMNKITLAEKVTAASNKLELKNVLDLDKKMKEVIKTIKSWQSNSQ